jgi:hypothetical protein
MDAERTAAKQVTVRLSYDEEAVVPSDMLSRWERDGTQVRLPFEDAAEQMLIWDLTASFEPLIDEVFSSRYIEFVEQARNRVRDP